MRAFVGSKVRKSPRTSRAISAIWPAISTPVGPAPTTTKVSSAAWRVGVGLELGRLEGLEDPPADGQRALERLELGRVLLPLVVAEVGVLRAAGDDQRVVLERLGRGAQRDVAQRRRGARRGRRRPPRRARRARCAGGGRCAAAGSRSRPARRRPWPPGRPAAGRGGSCADRRASPRPAGARASGRPVARRSRRRRRRRDAARTGVGGAMPQILPDARRAATSRRAPRGRAATARGSGPPRRGPRRGRPACRP